MKKWIFVIVIILLISLINFTLKNNTFATIYQNEKFIDCHSVFKDFNRSYTIINKEDTNKKNYFGISTGQNLYRFVLINKGAVPFDQEWPPFLQSWIQKWIPLCGNPIAGVGIHQEDFNKFSRTVQKTIRKYDQVTYKGWGLFYTIGEDVEIPGLWEKIPVDVEPFDQGSIGGAKVNGGP
jgi:hypothetical protein